MSRHQKNNNNKHFENQLKTKYHSSNKMYNTGQLQKCNYTIRKI